jgi:hypothetical protein
VEDDNDDVEQNDDDSSEDADPRGGVETKTAKLHHKLSCIALENASAVASTTAATNDRSVEPANGTEAGRNERVILPVSCWQCVPVVWCSR